MSQPNSTINSAPLAIIVPAFKTRFLRAALESIAAQSSRNFTLYVFDDCSPEPVAEIAKEFSARLPLQFYRFEKNLGGISLVKHWERCIRLTCEPWIWIFADDDLMDANCVEKFFSELAATNSANDLYRFNTFTVDAEDKMISENPSHPLEESGADYLLARLGGRRVATLQEAIFSRAAWQTIGGIPDFPLAWHSDEAFAAAMGVRSPLRLISGARVHWRFSSFNITGTSSFKTGNRKIIASTIYFRWLKNFFQTHAPAKWTEAARVSENWLREYLAKMWSYLGWRTCFALDAVAKEVWRRPRGWGFAKAMEVNGRLGMHKIDRMFRR